MVRSLPALALPAVGPTGIRLFVPRRDGVDLALGVKVIGTAAAFVSAIVPLANDGLRAHVMPAGGPRMELLNRDAATSRGAFS